MQGAKLAAFMEELPHTSGAPQPTDGRSSGQSAAPLESETLFRAFYEENPCMCFTVSAGNQMLSANQNGAEHLGYTVNELVGRSVFDVFHKDDHAVLRQQLADCIGHPGKCASWELRKVRKDGSLVWVRETARAVPGPGGSPVILIVCEDITERIHAEQQLRALNKELESRIADRTRELRTRNDELQEDLLMASEIQKAFMPQQYPTFPRGVDPAESALQFCHRYLPIGSVGGDFFNVLALSDTSAGVFLCDVMGHGVRSALVTAVIRGLVEDLSSVAADSGRFLTKINSSFVTTLKQTGWPTFASAFYMVVDAASGKAQYTIAGHPNSVLLRRGTKKVERLPGNKGAAGPALALFQETVYSSAPCLLAPGDSVVLFTDGLYEVANTRGEEFGLERLLTTMQQRLHLPAPDLLDTLLDEVRDFAGGQKFEDDVCLAAIHLKE